MDTSVGMKSNAYLGAEKARDVSDIDACCERLNKIASSVESHVERLDNLHDRLYGGGGKVQATCTEPQPVPSGSIGRLRDAVERFERANTMLDNAVSSLGSVA